MTLVNPKRKLKLFPNSITEIEYEHIIFFDIVINSLKIKETYAQ